jgi:hypothetical protein
MWDAAYPVGTWPKGYSIGAGYIGGDTPHIWTTQEWGRYGKRRKLPIYTQNHPNTATAEQEGFAALKRLYEIECPKGNPVAWDAEDAVNHDWSNIFASVLAWGGYRLWVYGQASTVFNNLPHNGYWVAGWTGTPYMSTHPDVRATQYASGKDWDSSTVKPWQYTYRFRPW